MSVAEKLLTYEDIKDLPTEGSYEDFGEEVEVLGGLKLKLSEIFGGEDG